MTAASILQFYAPFVGLMALSFWMGSLTQRVRQLEKGGDATKTLATDMAEVRSDIRHISSSVDELKKGVAWITTPAPTASPTARRPK